MAKDMAPLDSLGWWLLSQPYEITVRLLCTRVRSACMPSLSFYIAFLDVLLALSQTTVQKPTPSLKPTWLCCSS